MQSDAERFRRRDGSLAEQSPAAPAPQAPSAFGASYGSPAQHPAPTAPGLPPAPAGSAIPGQPAPQRYALPNYVAPHYATSFDGRDAPLIHPAAAQASSVTPYGVPVYQAPGFAYAPQPARGLSITALVLGGCSFLFAWVFVVVPIIGLVFGFIALKREPAGKSMAIVGLVASALGVLWVLLFYLLPLLAFLGAMVVASGGV